MSRGNRDGELKEILVNSTGKAEGDLGPQLSMPAP